MYVYISVLPTDVRSACLPRKLCAAGRVIWIDPVTHFRGAFLKQRTTFRLKKTVFLRPRPDPSVRRERKKRSFSVRTSTPPDNRRTWSSVPILCPGETHCTNTSITILIYLLLLIFFFSLFFFFFFFSRRIIFEPHDLPRYPQISGG